MTRPTRRRRENARSVRMVAEEDMEWKGCGKVVVEGERDQGISGNTRQMDVLMECSVFDGWLFQ